MAKKTTKTSSGGGRKRNGKNILDGDPPIIIGGGGSTWIWIRRDQNPQLFDPNNVPTPPGLPDPVTMPDNPGLYNALYLADLTVTTVDFRNGLGGGSGPQKPKNNKKQNTRFG